MEKGGSSKPLTEPTARGLLNNQTAICKPSPISDSVSRTVGLNSHSFLQVGGVSHEAHRGHSTCQLYRGARVR